MLSGLRKALWFTCVLLSSQASAQTPTFSYTKASELSPLGEIFPLQNMFQRVDTVKYNTLPPVVKQLLVQSAGKAIAFKTNSRQIMAKWCVSSKGQLTNLSPIAQKGLDLYIRRGDEWVFAGVGRPNKSCNDELLIGDMDDSEKECLLYLPLYDQTKSLEIGVENGSFITKIANPFSKRVLVYGSSITQGASVSRPGLAYPARLSRSTGVEFLNLGMSGNAKMHPEVADMIADISADAFILDCVPNSSVKEIKERTANLVNTIRKKHPDGPIIMIQSIVRELGNFNTKTRAMVKGQNEAYQQEYQDLITKGVKNLYFIREANFLGTDHEGTIDGTHPNDLGFDRFLEAIEPEIRKILRKHNLLSDK